MTQRGPTERAARRFVRDLGDLTGPQATLAEACYLVAKALDQRDGPPDMATAANLRELRATLQAIREAGDGGNVGVELAEQLSAPVVDAPDAGAGDAGRSGGAGRGDARDAVDALAAARRRRGARSRP